MAGEWLPMRLDLDEDPAVIRICGATGLDDLAVIGRLWKLWRWANRQLRDGDAPGVTDVWIDRYVAAPGFAQAMAAAGWLTITPDGVRFPSFDEWNSQGAKNRLLTAKRNRELRHRKSAGTVTTVTTPSSPDRHQRIGEESKSRETPPNPPEGGDGGVPDGGGEPAKKAKKARSTPRPREPDPLFEALAAATGADRKTAAGHVAKVAANLRKAEPPYTAADVAEFARRVGDFLPWAKAGYQPTLNQVEQHIGKLRAAPDAGGRGPGGGRVPGRVYAGDAAAPTAAEPPPPDPPAAPPDDPPGHGADARRGGPPGPGGDPELAGVW